MLSSVTLSLFPLLYFFTFLYYTDTGSTAFVLLSYLCSLKSRHSCAALSGLCAVLFRQTNIVWVVFVGASSACDVILGLILRTEISELARKTYPNQLRTVFLWARNSLTHDRYAFIRVAVNAFAVLWSYFIVVVLFGIFLIINGSIVVGAKQDHGAGFHLPQLFYFCAFAVVFSFPHFIKIGTIRSLLKFIRKHYLVVLTACVLSSLAIFKLTYIHRYLLADNRHYTFYIWSRIISRNSLTRYLLVPVYLSSMYALVYAVAAHKHIFWQVLFACCCGAVLVPSTLLELRYFIVPYLILRLNIPCPSYRCIVAELVLYVAVNSLTFYLFLYRPFYWPSDPGHVQRFMW